MTLDQILAIGALVIALPSGIGSIFALLRSDRTKRELEVSRVEIGRETSNTNKDSPWERWVYAPSGSTTTRYVGVSKPVAFSKPFVEPPEVVSSLALVNVKRLSELISSGFIPGPDDWEADGSPEGHVVTRVEDVTRNGFKLRIGIGAPTDIGEALVRALARSDLNPDQEEEAIRFNHVTNRSGRFHPDEKWVLNFYFNVGTIDVAWVAKRHVCASRAR